MPYVCSALDRFTGHCPALTPAQALSLVAISGVGAAYLPKDNDGNGSYDVYTNAAFDEPYSMVSIDYGPAGSDLLLNDAGASGPSNDDQGPQTGGGQRSATNAEVAAFQAKLAALAKQQPTDASLKDAIQQLALIAKARAAAPHSIAAKPVDGMEPARVVSKF